MPFPPSAPQDLSAPPAAAAGDGGRLVREPVAEAEDVLLAQVIHDLRGPVVTVTSWARLLLAHEDESVVRAGRAILSSGTRLERLVDDLAVSEVAAAERVELRTEPVELSALVHQVAEERTGLAVRIEDGGRRHVAEVDRVRIAQVVDNLLANAEAHADARVGADVLLLSDPRDAEIRVTSVGARLAIEDVRGLFEPWVRRSGSDGNGLGLSIVRALVRAHGGRVGVDVDGGRTTFWVRLPRTFRPGTAAIPALG